jgi:hypothetical protein
LGNSTLRGNAPEIALGGEHDVIPVNGGEPVIAGGGFGGGGKSGQKECRQQQGVMTRVDVG